MKKLMLIMLGILAGCSSQEPQLVIEDHKPKKYQFEPVKHDKENNHSVSYYDKPLIKNVNHYIKWLTQDLFANIDFPDNDAVFVISDLALLDSDLNKTNHFGRQVTEAMTHEVNRTGFSVIDIKARGFIRMSESGDLFFQTEDYNEILSQTSATNIISGTMTRHRGGYLINARVVDLATTALISSAQIFVPYDVVDAVMLEDQVSPPPKINEISLKPSSVRE
ncbi:hypothetical protein SG34_028605 [Thalassomonas viridans]|uniref:FlgO domain-containing protein n=1 Tax=Thalassomonas viridans TaxID=137584 RepID=A0AAE9Z265_9GAMM|nr:FlgO family outer membrane protein [Thalassomonas viridans]WDE05208.1 hypothetical protein SG34_028605 [Thalassomonas viridans]